MLFASLFNRLIWFLKCKAKRLRSLLVVAVDGINVIMAVVAAMVVIALLITPLKAIIRIIAVIAMAIILIIVIAYKFLINFINIIKRRASLLNVKWSNLL